MKLCNFFSKDTTKWGGCQGGLSKKNGVSVEREYRTTPLTRIVSTIRFMLKNLLKVSLSLLYLQRELVSVI